MQLYHIYVWCGKSWEAHKRPNTRCDLPGDSYRLTSIGHLSAAQQNYSKFFFRDTHNNFLLWQNSTGVVVEDNYGIVYDVATAHGEVKMKRCISTPEKSELSQIAGLGRPTYRSKHLRDSGGDAFSSLELLSTLLVSNWACTLLVGNWACTLLVGSCSHCS